MAKTYEDIQQQIAALQRQAEQLRSEEVAGVVARIKDAIKTYGLTAADLGFGGKGKGAPAKPSSKSASKAAKFRDARGNEWVGRGPRPQWLRDALAAGKTLQDFAV